MHDDPGYARFFTYLNLFVFSMVMLVLAGNFLVLYVFWEAVGLCSYLLIGFWYEKKSAADAGKKAFIVNRVGDFGFGLGIMLIWVTFGTLDYGEVFAKADASVAAGTYTAIALLLFMGACGKSAQLPLYTWLPDAMEGPTPGLRAHPRRDHGDRGRVHGGALPQALRDGAALARDGGVGRRRSPPCSRPPSASCRPTSSACSRTPPSASSATCSWAWGWARTPRASSTS